MQRWLKFSKYLPDNDWHCIVCTPENPSFDIKDSSLESEIHPDTEVLKIPIWEPYTLFKKLKKQDSLDQGVTPAGVGALSRFVRGNFFIPDPRRFWVKPAVRFLSQFLKGRKVDAIITTGPPHSMHLIGRKLHKKFRLPWIADFRDPWSRWDMLDEFNLTGFAKRRHRQLEHKVVTQATGVITVSQEWADELHRDHGVTPKVITNGFDEGDNLDFKSDHSLFQISHAGLLNQFRDIPAFWDILAVFQKENNETPKLVLRGMIDNQIYQNLLKVFVPQNIDVAKSVSHQQVKELYKESFVLLLIMNKTENAKGHLPGKLFEYIATGRWVLGIGDPDGEAAKILKYTGTGRVVHWEDKKGMLECLKFFKSKYSIHELPRSINIEEFTRSNLTNELASYLNELV